MNKFAKIIFCSSVFSLMAVLIIPVVSAEEQTLKQKDEDSRLKYQEAWGQYQKEVNFYKTAREEFLSARTKLQNLKNADSRKNLEDKTKSFLGKTISALTKKLESLKNWVMNKRALAEADKQSIVAEIEKDIQWLKNKSEGLAGATPEEIKKEAKNVREYWRKHRLWMKKITGQIWAARVNFVIAKAEEYAVKISAKIDELKAAGKSTAQLEAWLLEYKSHIALAKEKYDAAKTKFAEIKVEFGADFENELKAADEMFKAGHKLVKEANQHIKEAYSVLRKIVNDMKKASRAAETPAVTE